MPRLGYLNPVAHKLLWLCLLGLTIRIIFWPVAPSPSDPLPVQSIYAIKQLPWFIAVFSGWVATLGALLFMVKGSVWERLALCLVFVLVFVQFWVLTSPLGIHADSVQLMTQVSYLQQHGRLPEFGSLSFSYLDYPGLQFTDLALSLTSGMNIFRSTVTFLMVSGVLLSLFLYLIFVKMLDSPRLSAMATVLAVAGSMTLGSLSNLFHPINTATILIGVLFVLLLRLSSTRFTDLSTIALIAVVVIGSTISYVFTPVLICMTLLSIAYMIGRSRDGYRLPFVLILFTMIAFAGWLVFLTHFAFFAFVNEVSVVFSYFAEGKAFLVVIEALKGHVGASYPWWGTLATFFWWISLFGLGSILMLKRVLQFKRLTLLSKTQTCLFLGTLITVGIGALAYRGILHGGLQRYVWLAPFTVAPALVAGLSSFRVKALALAFGVAGLIFLLPTWLTNNDTISGGRLYVSQVDAATFIAERVGDQQPTVYTDGALFAPLLFSTGSTIVRPIDVMGTTKLELEESLGSQIKDFSSYSIDDRPHALYYSSTTLRLGYEEWLGLKPDDPLWNSFDSDLGQHQKVYDCGETQIYLP